MPLCEPDQITERLRDLVLNIHKVTFSPVE